MNATSMTRSIGNGPNENQRLTKHTLMDAKIMASYDSVLMDTQSTVAGMDAASVRSSVAPSSRFDQEDEYAPPLCMDPSSPSDLVMHSALCH